MNRQAEERPPRPLRRRRRVAVECALWCVTAATVGAATWSRGETNVSVQPTAAPVAVAVATSVGPSEGAWVGRLILPRLGIESVVAEGVTQPVLLRAVGRVPASARPGEPGNIALAGGRDAFLRALADVREGDAVVLVTPEGEERYRVEWRDVVDPRDIHVMADTSYPALTLIAPYPLRQGEAAPGRFVIRARRLGSSSADGDIRPASRRVR